MHVYHFPAALYLAIVGTFLTTTSHANPTAFAEVSEITFLVNDLNLTDGIDAGFVIEDNVYPFSPPVTRISKGSTVLSESLGAFVPLAASTFSFSFKGSGTVSVNENGLWRVTSEIEQISQSQRFHNDIGISTQTGRLGYTAIDGALTLLPNTELIVSFSSRSQVSGANPASGELLLYAHTKVSIAQKSFFTNACSGSIVSQRGSRSDCNSYGFGGVKLEDKYTTSFSLQSGSNSAYLFPFEISADVWAESNSPVPEPSTAYLLAIGASVLFIRRVILRRSQRAESQSSGEA